MRTWYKFSAKAEQPEVAELSIFDYIGYYGVEAKQFNADLAKITAETIEVSVNSPGGDVFQAVAIMNMLRGCGKQIHMKVLGIAASAASYILLAGHKRSMPDNTMQMLHNASTGAWGNAEELGEVVDVLKKVDANLHATFVSRTGQTAEKIAELLSKDTYLTAEECLELGLCDEVTPAIKVTAAYETESLPDHVQALFKAAATPPAETPLSLPERIKAALAAEPSLAEFEPVFAADTSLVDEATVTAAIQTAKEIVAYCAMTGMPDKAPAMIRARTPVADVRKALNEALVLADEANVIDTAPKGAASEPAAKGEVFNSTALWAQINAMKKAGV